MKTTIYCGIDEAGRGPLCGPVFAAAVIIPDVSSIPGLRDSKKLSARRRDELAAQIRELAIFGIGQADGPEIDRINILQASFLAMRRAVSALETHPAAQSLPIGDLALTFLVDGNKAPSLSTALPFASQSCACLVGGDDLEPSISAASILAKTSRDAWIEAWVAANDPGDSYGMLAHKGYPTPLHVQKLAELGPSPIHRASFRVRRLAVSGTNAGTGELPEN